MDVLAPGITPHCMNQWLYLHKWIHLSTTLVSPHAIIRDTINIDHDNTSIIQQIGILPDHATSIKLDLYVNGSHTKRMQN